MRKISELPAVSASQDADLLPTVQNGVTSRLTRAQLVAGLASEADSVLRDGPDRIVLSTADGAALIAAVATGRHVLLLPGVYDLGGQTVALATEGQTVAGVEGGDRSVVVRSTGLAVLKQTAAVVHLRNLRLDDSNFNFGLQVDVPGAAANDGSTYDRLSMTGCPAGAVIADHGDTTPRNLSGRWAHVDAPGQPLFVSMWGCFPSSFHAHHFRGGTNSVYGRERNDTLYYASGGARSIEFDGTIEDFETGDALLGCTGIGGNIGPNARIRRGKCGDKSIGLGCHIAAGAVIEDVAAGVAAFCGCAGASPYNATVDAVDGTVLTITDFADVEGMRASLVGMTILRAVDSAAAKIVGLVDAPAKKVRLDTAWPTGQTYAVQTWVEGWNAGTIRRCTYTYNATYPCLGTGVKYARNDGLMEDVRPSSAAVDLAGASVGFNAGSSLQAFAGSGLWVRCNTAGPIATANGNVHSPADSGATYVNTGAASPWNTTLPPARVGMRFRFVQVASQIWQVNAASGDTIRGNSAIYCLASPGKASLSLVCLVAHTWHVESASGTWT